MGGPHRQENNAFVDFDENDLCLQWVDREVKTPGQVAYDAHGVLVGRSVPWGGLSHDMKAHWERVADAVKKHLEE